MAEAIRLEARLQVIYRRNEFCEEIAVQYGYHARLISALDQALTGLPVTNADYRTEHGIAAITASNDLRRLVDDGWLTPTGAGRGARYIASAQLQQAWHDMQVRPGAAT
jgi:hypothetical protein